MNRIAQTLAAPVPGLVLLCPATLTRADARNPTKRSARTPAGADGIGKRCMGRDIAGVMGRQGTVWLGREECADHDGNLLAAIFRQR